MLLRIIGQRLAAACMLFAALCLFAPLGCKYILSHVMGEKAYMIIDMLFSFFVVVFHIFRRLTYFVNSILYSFVI